MHTTTIARLTGINRALPDAPRQPSPGHTVPWAGAGSRHCSWFVKHRSRSLPEIGRHGLLRLRGDAWRACRGSVARPFRAIERDPSVGNEPTRGIRPCDHVVGRSPVPGNCCLSYSDQKCARGSGIEAVLNANRGQTDPFRSRNPSTTTLSRGSPTSAKVIPYTDDWLVEAQDAGKIGRRPGNNHLGG